MTPTRYISSKNKRIYSTQFLQSEFLKIAHIGALKGCAVANQHDCIILYAEQRSMVLSYIEIEPAVLTKFHSPTVLPLAISLFRFPTNRALSVSTQNCQCCTLCCAQTNTQLKQCEPECSDPKRAHNRHEINLQFANKEKQIFIKYVRVN